MGSLYSITSTEKLARLYDNLGIKSIVARLSVNKCKWTNQCDLNNASCINFSRTFKIWATIKVFSLLANCLDLGRATWRNNDGNSRAKDFINFYFYFIGSDHT